MFNCPRGSSRCITIATREWGGQMDQPYCSCPSWETWTLKWSPVQVPSRSGTEQRSWLEQGPSRGCMCLVVHATLFCFSA